MFHPPPPPATPAAEIRYVGGPTVLIDVAGLRFATDPTFAPPGRYPSGPVTLEKTEGPAIALEELGHVDAVLLSHDQHADNLDPKGRELVAKVPTFTTRAGAARLGGTATGLAPWESRELTALDGTRVRITATPARHGPAGIEPLLGDVIGFVLSVSGSSNAEPARDLIYVTGDTVWYAGTAEVARRFHPAAVVLFAGAARTRGAFTLTMTVNEAVEAAAAFPDSEIVPVHHAGWAHFSQSQGDLVKTFEVVGMGARLKTLTAGERYRFLSQRNVLSPSR